MVVYPTYPMCVALGIYYENLQCCVPISTPCFQLNVASQSQKPNYLFSSRRFVLSVQMSR
jgi:hypothetical protein